MVNFRLFSLLMLATGMCSAVNAEAPSSADWQRASPGAVYSFPADHEIHPEFKTEWWYFTGTLRGENGKEYGYELTFFRQGALPPGVRASRHDMEPGTRSQFVQNDFKFAHFAVSELNGRRFHFTQKINRGAFEDAGFGHPLTGQPGSPTPEADCLAWIDNWSLRPQPDGSWKISAKAEEPTAMSVDLTVVPEKAPVIEGVDGVSQKAAGQGNASYYYSYTRLKTSGILVVGGDEAQTVKGESWFDHEWASNQLAADQVGWDWFCFQFDDRTELMLYAMRRRDGTVDPVSSGTWVSADGGVEHLKFGDFTLRPNRTWHSKQTDAIYPVAWQVEVPSHRLSFAVDARFNEQELVLPPISYWEGAIGVSGHRGDQPLKGHGYMELTGYAGALKELQGPSQPTDTHLRGTPR